MSIVDPHVGDTAGMSSCEPPLKRAKLEHEGAAAAAEVAMADARPSSAPAPVQPPAASSTMPPSAASLFISSSESLSPFPSSTWSYVNRAVLAPMVRIGTLPMRRLAVDYGAHMVYSEELVAKKLRNCVRTEHTDEQGRTLIRFTPHHNSGPTKPPAAQVADAAAAVPASAAAPTPAAPAKPQHNSKLDNYATLITYPNEPLVVQIGASNADDALAAAKVVERDAKAIDINMGCPKHFSLQGGMGAALLSKPETVVDILTTLRRNIQLPITCKIRLLEKTSDTIDLVRLIERCGVSAIAVHARRIEDRPRHRALREQIRAVASSIRIPLIYNGDCFYGHELQAIRDETGASSVMIARGAMWNASIFRPDGVMLPLTRVITDYMSLAREVSNHMTNTKYCVMEMLKGHCGASALFRMVTRSRTMEDLEKALREGMEKEVALTRAGRDYTVPVVVEDRPTPCASAAASAAGASAAESAPVSKKEQKYQKKQNRKNREGRKAELDAAAATPASASAVDAPPAATPAEPAPAAAAAAMDC